jgi:hypothetical protein
MYIFTVRVYYEDDEKAPRWSKYSIHAANDVEARKKALDLFKGYKEKSDVLKYCEIEFESTLDA